jgi:hypothetical protein
MRAMPGLGDRPIGALGGPTQPRQATSNQCTVTGIQPNKCTVTGIQLSPEFKIIALSPEWNWTSDKELR